MNKIQMSFDTTWHPAWAIMEYRRPCLRYNQPNAKPRPPFRRKHLNMSIGVKPSMRSVAGRCAAAKSNDATIFDATRTGVDGISLFFSKSL